MSRLACRKWLLRALVVLVILGTIGLVAARLYLSSASAARLVAGKIGAFLGQEVVVGSFQGALAGNSAFQNVELHDPADGAAYFQARSATADLSVWRLLGGASNPSTLTFDRATLR